ncbi:MAG TPA: S8 family serine peptidase [Solimonas sp.]
MSSLKSVSAASAAVLLLAACGGSSAPGTSAPPTPSTPIAKNADSCDAAYAAAEAEAKAGAKLGTPVRVSERIGYGQPGRLILSFRFDVERKRAAQALQKLPLLNLVLDRSLFAYRNLPMLYVNLPLVTPQIVETLERALAPLGLVSIYPDERLQYHLADSNEYIGARIARQTYGLDGRGVTVAVIDSGIYELQGDFGNVVENKKIIGNSLGVVSLPQLENYLLLDVTGLDSDTTSGHGTHVAGTVAGTGAMSGGELSGMAPGAGLIGIGTGEAIFVSYALEAFDYLVNPDLVERYNLRVTNNSYGPSGAGGFEPFHPINLATKAAHDLGIYSVFAAGNAGSPSDDGTVSNHNPYGASPCTISVASGIANANVFDPINALLGLAPDQLFTPDRRGQLSTFSSRGLAGDVFDHPNITAPGDLVAAAYNPKGAVLYAGVGAPYVNPQHPQWSLSYYRISGTSMASPHIAGIVALLLQADPELGWDELQAALYETATPMVKEDGTPYALWEAGHGFVNVKAALDRVIAEAPARRVERVQETLTELSGIVSVAVSDPVLGLSLLGASTDFEFELPEGATYESMTVSAKWLVPANDLDLVVIGPDGEVVATSGNAAGSFESARLRKPLPGHYIARVNGFLNTPDRATVTVDVVKLETRDKPAPL